MKFKNFISNIINKDILTKKHTFIRTRFPPEPNGYLHIGHAKSICLNFGIAAKYRGKCYLRFDDTNPNNESIEFVNSIKEDIEWLGFKWHGKIRYTSDYFEKIYNYAIELIKKNLAYVDKLSPKEIKKYRGTINSFGIESPYRNTNVKDNLNLFKKMRNGEFKEGSMCLRAKIDMSSPYIIMRDPVLYRINFKSHYKTNNLWCIYPTYDFSHCISDALEGITHSLCTLEFQENRRLYDWILSKVKIYSNVRQYEFSRLNLEFTTVSKRNLKILVENRLVDGWDDPRMPTISGLRRRGYTASSIRKFCSKIGITRKDSNIKISVLESCLRKELNKSALRFMAVIDPVLIIIENLPVNYKKEIHVYKNPCNRALGKRTVITSSKIYIDRDDFKFHQNDRNYKRLTLNQKVRLKYFCTIQVKKVIINNSNNIEAIICTGDFDSLNVSKNKYGIIHWVSALYSDPAEFRIYNNLFLSSIVEKDFISCINSKSLVTYHGYVESNKILLKEKKPVQFERQGYFLIDKKSSRFKNLVFNRTLSLKSKFNK